MKVTEQCGYTFAMCQSVRSVQSKHLSYFYFSRVEFTETSQSGAHYPEPPSSILTLESTLSRIFLLLEAPPTGVFAGVFIIANHERAAVLYCYKSNAAT